MKKGVEKDFVLVYYALALLCIAREVRARYAEERGRCCLVVVFSVCSSVVPWSLVYLLLPLAHRIMIYMLMVRDERKVSG